jgi:hypothetical protein
LDFFLASRIVWRAWDGASLCDAAVDTRFAAAGALPGGSAPIGTRTAVAQANGFWPWHGGKRGGG